MLNAKRLMAIVLMLAMLLTMASFPAFAGESFKAPLTYVSGKVANADHANRKIDKAIDGDPTTHFSSDQYKGSQGSLSTDLIFELPNVSVLDKLVIKWGGNAWGQMGVDSYNVLVSADNVEYTQILTYTGIYTTPENYAGYEHVDGSKGGANLKYNMTETGLNASDVKYIKLELRNGQYRPSIFEIEAYVAGDPVEFTVEYVDEEGNAIAETENKLGADGGTSTVAAKEIFGYELIGEATQSIVLNKDGENKIVFKYKKLATIDYVIEFVDEEGNNIADPVTGFDFEGATITGTALEVLGYELIGEATQTITLTVGGANKITFTYETLPVVFYDVKYVDENGKEIAPTKTDIDVNGAAVTETAVNVAGYICTSSATKELVLDENGTNVITFEYAPIPRKEVGKLTIDPANIKWPSMCTQAQKENDKLCLSDMDAIVDGEIDAISRNEGFMTSTHYGNKGDEITIDLGGLYNVDSLKLYWGNRLETWNLVPSGAYTVSVAGADGEFGEPIYVFTDPGATASPMVVPANRERVDVVDLAGSADFVQYVKITSTNNYGRRLTIREIEVNAEEAIASNSAATVTVEHYDVDGNKIENDIFTADNLGTIINITPTEIAGYKYVGTADLEFELAVHGENYVVELVYQAIPNVVGVPAEEAYFATNSSNVPFFFSVSTPTNASPADVFAVANWVVDNAEVTSVNVTANDNPATLVFEWDVVVNVKPVDNTAFAVELDLPDTYELTDKVRF